MPLCAALVHSLVRDDIAGHKGIVLATTASDAIVATPMLSELQLLQKDPMLDETAKPPSDPGVLAEVQNMVVPIVAKRLVPDSTDAHI